MALPLLIKIAIGYGIVKWLGGKSDEDDDDKPDRAGKYGDADGEGAEDSGDSGSDPPGHELEDGDPVEGQTAMGAKAMRKDGKLLVACRADSPRNTAPLIWWEAKPGNPCCKEASGSTFTYGSNQLVCALDDFSGGYTWKDVKK